MGHISARWGRPERVLSNGGYKCQSLPAQYPRSGRNTAPTPAADDAVRPQGCNKDRPLPHVCPYLGIVKEGEVKLVNKKAVISEDGRSLEVYAGGRRYVVALGFSVWDIVDPAKEPEVGEALDIERSLGGGRS